MGDHSFDSIVRPAAYGLSGIGNTDGNSSAIIGEVGYLKDSGTYRYGPLVGFRWMETESDAYTETGASGGNIAYQDLATDGTTGYVGGEVSMELGNLRSILRVIYMPEDDSDGTAGSVRLASSTHAMGTQAVNVTSTQAYVEPSLTLAGHDAEAWDWWLNYGARIGSDKGTEHRVTAGFRVLF